MKHCKVLPKIHWLDYIQWIFLYIKVTSCNFSFYKCDRKLYVTAYSIAALLYYFRCSRWHVYVSGKKSQHLTTACVPKNTQKSETFWKTHDYRNSRSCRKNSEKQPRVSHFMKSAFFHGTHVAAVETNPFHPAVTSQTSIHPESEQPHMKWWWGTSSSYVKLWALCQCRSSQNVSTCLPNHNTSTSLLTLFCQHVNIPPDLFLTFTTLNNTSNYKFLWPHYFSNIYTDCFLSFWWSFPCLREKMYRGRKKKWIKKKCTHPSHKSSCQCSPSFQV